MNREAVAFLDRISTKFPEWQLEADESDEFPVWMGAPEDRYRKENSPKELPSLKQWLLIERDGITDDDWSDRCKNDFLIAISALTQLSDDGRWPIQRWRTALQVWSDQSLVQESWSRLHNVFTDADETTITNLAQPLSWWLQAVGKIFIDGESSFFKLVHRILGAQADVLFESGDDPIFKTINHPIGQITDAVFRWWYRQGLEDDQGLKTEPRITYSHLANLHITSFRYGRIIMAANLIALFRVDPEWTKLFMLRNFEWSVNAAEARAAWVGFLWAPRLHVPLLASMKSQFLDTARHYTTLGQFAQQYANLLTFVALEASEPITKKELALATSLLPAEGLARCALSLVQGLDGAGEKRVEYWQNRVRPYLREIWPKSVDAHSRSVANSFVRLCMKAGNAFPDAVDELKPWLSGVGQADVTLHEFRDTGLAKRFPEASLKFLDAIVTQTSFLLADDLRTSLNDLIEERPNLRSDPRFERLTRYARELGG